MKKLLLLVATLTTLTAKSQTSVYHPFPEDSATWCDEFCTNQGNDFSEGTYQLSGKVLINGNWYSRMLYYSRDCYGASMCYCGQLLSSDTTTLYIRQDTAQKKVWLYYPPANSDTIFLDFDLQVGDTIDGRKAYWARVYSPWSGAIVSSIDSILIGSQYRKRYNYEMIGYTYGNSMIEGIGPTHGLFQIANIGLYYMAGLNIFAQNNQLFYPWYSPVTTGMGQYCHDFTTSVEAINETAFRFSFPNPSSGNFTIRFSQYLSKGSIEIYSAIGEKVYRENIFNESKKEITLKNIPCGIYFVKVLDGEKNYCRKLIVEHN